MKNTKPDTTQITALIKNDLDLIKVLETPELHLNSKIKIACSYLNVHCFFIESESELIKNVKHYIKTFKNVAEKPRFLQQRELAFQITDIYNHDNKENKPDED